MTGLDSQHRHDGILMKQVIPSDNCCLFTSLQFALNHTVDTDVAPSMRRMVAEEISKDPLTFNDVFLGIFRIQNFKKKTSLKRILKLPNFLRTRK